jgi:hypothetical protein
MFDLLDGYPDSVVAVRGTGRVTAEGSAGSAC